MLGAFALASRPLAAAPRLPRPSQMSATNGEYGWAAWCYSRQAKLNAWCWSGVGGIGNINNWATLGNTIYVRGESDNRVYAIQPNAFRAGNDVNAESTSVEATTQWLDFGKPGKMKALTGIDFDGQNVVRVEVYVSVNGDRRGQLAESVDIGDNQGGWTYNGEVIPLSTMATEFKLRFVGDANLEVQINRLTLYFDEVAG